MKRPGRNQPCRCGSGKKYKRCCLPADEEAARKERQLAQELASAKTHDNVAAFLATLDTLQEELLDNERFVDDSNAVVDLIHAGKLDEAESAALELIDRYPGATDGLERLGHVFEVRGDPKTAARHYRDAIAQAERLRIDSPDHYEDLRRLADRLDPP